MDALSEQWPPPTGPDSGIYTPTVSRSEIILPTIARTAISAPAALVFSILLDTSTYPSWCTFVPRATIHTQPEGVDSSSKTFHVSTHFSFHAAMDPSKPQKSSDTELTISDISMPEAQTEYIPRSMREDPKSGYTADLSKVYRVSWKAEGGFANRGLKSERFHEVIVMGEHECEVRTWELMGGFLARTVKWFYAKTLQARFEDWCADLKKYAEGKVKGEGEEGEMTAPEA